MSPRTPFKCWQRVCVSVGGPSCFSYFRGLGQIFLLLLLVLSATLLLLSTLDISSFFLVLSLFHQSIVLFDALSSELFQDIVKVSGVGEAVARQVGAKLGLMVDLEDKERMSSFVHRIGNEIGLTPNWQSFVSCYSLTFFDGHCYSQAHHQQQTHL